MLQKNKEGEKKRVNKRFLAGNCQFICTKIEKKNRKAYATAGECCLIAGNNFAGKFNKQGDLGEGISVPRHY